MTSSQYIFQTSQSQVNCDATMIFLSPKSQRIVYKLEQLQSYINILFTSIQIQHHSWGFFLTVSMRISMHKTIILYETCSWKGK